MFEDIQKLEWEVLSILVTVETEWALVTYKNEIFWKNGTMTLLLKGIKDLSPEERGTIGKYLNEVRNTLETAFENRKEQIQKANIREALEKEWEDVTIPLADTEAHLHPITRVRNDVENTFRRMGFDIYESPEVTTEYMNFDAVNVPRTHPARDMQDTFWLEWDGNVLATQTSCMQNYILKNSKPPIRAIVPGRVFRNEDLDATHENTFYQVEGVVIDRHIWLAELKHTTRTMLQDIFGKEVNIRFRPGYFPFVEPGIEVDFSCTFCGWDGCRICKYTGWIEFMGAWLIHPNVLREGGLDPEEYSGFAFWFGLNRLVMMRYGIPDGRYFQNPDIRFIEQF